MKFACPHCGQHIEGKDRWEGQTINCPNEECRMEIRIPESLAPPTRKSQPKTGIILSENVPTPKQHSEVDRIPPSQITEAATPAISPPQVQKQYEATPLLAREDVGMPNAPPFAQAPSPTAETVAPVVASKTALWKPPPSFRNPTRLTAWLTILLVVSVLVEVVAIWSSSLQSDIACRMKNRVNVPAAEIEQNSVRRLNVRLFQIGVFLLTAITYSAWIYRAHNNATSLNGVPSLGKFSTRRAIANLFLPIWQILEPCDHMQQLWDATAPDVVNTKKRRGLVGNIILQGWKLFWGGFIVSLYVMLASPDNLLLSDPHAMQSELQLHQILYLPLCLITLLLIMKIYHMQMQRAVRSSTA